MSWCFASFFYASDQSVKLLCDEYISVLNLISTDEEKLIILVSNKISPVIGPAPPSLHICGADA